METLITLGKIFQGSSPSVHDNLTVIGPKLHKDFEKFNSLFLNSKKTRKMLIKIHYFCIKRNG